MDVDESSQSSSSAEDVEASPVTLVVMDGVVMDCAFDDCIEKL